MPPADPWIGYVFAEIVALEPQSRHVMPYHSAEMQVIRPANLKPGVSIDNLRSPGASASAADPRSRITRGTALVFGAPKLPGPACGKKLDAIDTDQITPAADCVSESLETLDERWKAGSFRYLMPD